MDVAVVRQRAWMPIALASLLVVGGGCLGGGEGGSGSGTAGGRVHGDGGPPSAIVAASPGWLMRTGVVGGFAVAEASTVPPRESDVVFPTRTVRRLPVDGVVIFAMGSVVRSRHRYGLPAPLAPPYTLSQFRHDRSWEGQPLARIPQYVLFTSRDRYLLAVYVFFGTQHPARDVFRKAQAELRTLSWG
jgi:hypothetical protein